MKKIVIYETGDLTARLVIEQQEHGYNLEIKIDSEALSTSAFPKEMVEKLFEGYIIDALIDMPKERLEFLLAKWLKYVWIPSLPDPDKYVSPYTQHALNKLFEGEHEQERRDFLKNHMAAFEKRMQAIFEDLDRYLADKDKE